MTFARGSSKYMSSAGKSKLEDIHNEAKQILGEKNAEISKLNQSIDEAEVQLKELKAQLRETLSKINKDPFDDNDDFMERQNDVEINTILEKNEDEIRELQQKHEEKLQRYKLQFGKSLKEAEQWSEQHIDAVYHEKMAKLTSLKQELEEAKAESQNAHMYVTSTRQQFYSTNKSASIQASQRITFLETQLTEITANSREELRDIKSKIDECLASVNVRQKEHKTELTKYEMELNQREEKYNMHVAALEEEFSAKKQRYQNEIDAENANLENLTKILKKIEKHHDKQMQSTLKDVENMKNTIYTAKARGDQAFEDTKATVGQAQNYMAEVREMEQEIAIMEQEINELNEENVQLKSEISKLDRAVYGRRL